MKIRLHVRAAFFLLAPVLLGSGCSQKLRVERPAGQVPEGMVWIPGGTFRMGGPSAEVCREVLKSADPRKPCCPMLQRGFADAQPVHEVEVDGFWMDEAEVTDAQFRKFVEATGYVTVAERKPKAEDFPGAPEEALVPGSLCFRRPPPDADLRDQRSWWEYLPGACWKRPQGPGSDLTGKEGQLSRGPCRLGGCGGVCKMGRQASAHGGGMGTGGAGRKRWGGLSLGERVPAGGKMDG